MKSKAVGIGTLIRLAGFVLMGVAIYEQMKRPPQERTWHGDVAGVVPYDFRRPTVEKVRDSFWQPENPSLFTPTVFGVGWSVNIPSLMREARRVSEIAISQAKSRFDGAGA